MLTKNDAKEPCDGLTSPIEEGWGGGGVGGRVVRIAWLFYAIATRRTCSLFLWLNTLAINYESHFR